MAAAAVGSRVILKNLPKKTVRQIEDKIAKWAFASVDSIKKNPLYRRVDTLLQKHPGGENRPWIEQMLREASVENFGLLHQLQTVSRIGNAGADFLEAFKKENLIKYDMEIPRLQVGSHRRMTLGDLYDAANQGHLDPKVTKVIKDIDLKYTADKLGMHVDDLSGLRLDPYLFVNAKTKELRNLRQLNFPGRGLRAIENFKPLGIPFFKIRGDSKADKFGIGVFGKLADDGVNYQPHAVVRMVTGEDQGQLVVMGQQAWFRKNKQSHLTFFKTLDDMALTSDYKMGETALRSSMAASEFDKSVLGLGKPSGWLGRLEQTLGVGPNYMNQGVHSLLVDLAHWDLDKVGKQPGFVGMLKRLAKKVDTGGFIGGAWKKTQRTGSSPGTSIGGLSPLLGSADADVGSYYLKRTGVGGFADWMNVQASRPYYLLNKLGIGMRPGKNFLTSTARFATLAAATYMGKEALSYADWAFGNPVSTAAGKIAGGAHWMRQKALEMLGASDAIAGIEQETPGLVNSPLSQMVRVGGLAVVGGLLSKKVGGLEFAGRALRKLASSERWGSTVATGLLENAATEKAAGSAVAGVLGGAITGLATLGDLDKPSSEVLEEMRGERQVAYRASAGWFLGRDPFSGGRVRFYRPSNYRSLGTDYGAIGVYGSEGNKWRYGSWLPTAQNWLGARRLLNPYFAEDRNYNTRPYPVTSGAFGEFPLFGPILQSTVGSIVKPTIERGVSPGQYMGMIEGINTATHNGGGGNGQYGGMGMGVNDVGTATNPNSMFTAGAESYRQFGEYIGLRGFQTQFLTNMLLGRPSLFPEQAILAESGKMTSVARSYYDAEPGGMFGTSELIRRFIVRPSGAVSINSLPNTMPRWMAGSRSMFEMDRGYYADFGQGDPYTKVPLGEARLPGPGRDALYSKHGGASYDVVDAFIISADVQPFTQSYHVLKREVERLMRQGKLAPEWIRKYQIAVEQAENRANFRVYHQRRYRKQMRAQIAEVISATKFRTTTGKLIEMEGTQLDYAEPNRLIAQRQLEGLSPAEAMMSIQADKTKLRQMLESKVGQTVEFDITGVKRGRIQARMQPYEEFAKELGVTESDTLRDQGLVGKAYTGAGKLLGEAGFVGGGLISLLAGRGKGKSIMAAIAGGIIGGWAENKFTGDFSSVEHYERFQKYGTAFADWSSPYKSFIRTWIGQGMSTLGDYTPGFRKEQYAIEEYFDKLKYAKAKQLEEAGGRESFMYGQQAKQTLVGLDYSSLTANTPGLHEALPSNERMYFRSFAKEQDPHERKRILEAVPDYMKAVYLAIWHGDLPKGESFEDTEIARMYAKHVVPRTKVSPDEQVRQYFENENMPGPESLIWHPQVDISDVKYRYIQMSGGSPHDHGLFQSQGRKIDAFAPFIDEAVADIQYRPHTGSIISMMKNLRRLDRKAQFDLIPTYGRQPDGNVVIQQDDTGRYAAHYDRMAAGLTGIY